MEILQTDLLISLHAQLDEHPDDWDTRLVLADVYEEMGEDELARVQRWMVENKKCSHLKTGRGKWEGKWWATNRRQVHVTDRDCLGDLYHVMSGAGQATTRQQAEEILRRALVATEFRKVGHVSTNQGDVGG